MKSISLLGCGWLGLPLGKFLVLQGYEVKGSVTTTEKFPILEAAGIQPFQLSLSPELEGVNTQNFFKSDILIINFPPKRRPDIEQYHKAQFEALIPHIKKHQIKYVVFVSSTSVYPNLNREVFEYDDLSPEKGSGKALKTVESMLMAEDSFQTTVVRFGGLVGYDRVPGRFLASKKEVSNPNAPINLIHQDDCIEIIFKIISLENWGEIFNACAEKHPVRKDYYRQAALQIGLKPPKFTVNTETEFKIINSDKLKKMLHFNFKYPDPIEMLKQQDKNN
ncbi:MAG: SDR family oxidoreductase [Opitutaceae bacterium]|nr:SDR family oxidoreductase [Cytophagales bacterium]